MAEQFIESTLMDGYVGGPHITETQTGLANQGLYGPDDYVLSSGRKAEAQVLTNNSIRIFDAVFLIQGRRDVIAANDYTDVSIDNGAQGMNRNDIIVRRYTKDESSEIENTEYAVIKGTPTSGEAEDPAVTTGDIRSGALEHEMKLYRVKLEGLNIVAVEPLFQVLMDMSTINKYLSDMSSLELDESMFAIESFWTVMELNAYKIGKTVYFNGEFLYTGQPGNLQPEVLYQLNKKSNDEIIRPKNISHLSMCATDMEYKNPVPGFAMITAEGLIKYSMPGKTQPYMFISGTYETN